MSFELGMRGQGSVVRGQFDGYLAKEISPFS